MNDELMKYGLPGIVIGGLCYAIIKLWTFVADIRKEHKQERDDWQKTIKGQFDEQNKATKESSGILQGLKTLLENRKP